jgi:cyclophilin family peptidyl-prolyl cis-trans isomerase
VKTLWNWLAARKAARKVVDSMQVGVCPPMVESLEDRRMLAVAAPHVVSVYADNRGLMNIKLDQKLNPASVSRKSVKVSRATGGADQAITNANISYSAAKRTITIKANTSADVVYRVRLISKIIKNTSGVKLDGEFKLTGKSGNGRPGGDWFGMTAPQTNKIARFTTTFGIMDVKLFTEKTATVANFLGYSNAGDWDGTVFHRSVKDFVIQGGGFKINGANKYTNVHNDPPTFVNEPGISNTRGTIAMARRDDNNPSTHDDENSATDQWFFNVKDNTSLDTSNGGFTVFGTVVKGLAIMDKINQATIGNASGVPNAFDPTSIASAFGELPVNKTIPEIQAEGFSPSKHSIIVTRIAVNQAVVKGVKV